jgi:hypothetical protein
VMPIFPQSLMYLQANIGVTDVVSVDRWQAEEAATSTWTEEDSHEC